jgi:hypothetical protein
MKILKKTFLLLEIPNENELDYSSQTKTVLTKG